MKDLKDFVLEVEDKDVFVVYFEDGTMYNFFYDESEANKVKDDLNKETSTNKCEVKKEKQSKIQK